VKARLVYPVEGVYLNGQPHVEHECDHPDCVKSGAFTEDPPPKAAAKTTGPAGAGPSDSTSKEK
jgi:hypothetical protein